MEIRTVNHLVSDLLSALIESEWSDMTDTSGCSHGCCQPCYNASCPDCGSLRDEDWRKHKAGEHDEGCKRKALINEVRAFLEIENALAKNQRREEDIVYIA